MNTEEQEKNREEVLTGRPGLARNWRPRAAPPSPPAQASRVATRELLLWELHTLAHSPHQLPTRQHYLGFIEEEKGQLHLCATVSQ